MLRTLLIAALLSTALLSMAPPAAASVPGDCPEKSWSVTVDSKHTVAVHSDCTMDVTLNEGIICVGPWVTKTEEQVGPVHVVAYGCGMPGGQPVILATALDTCPEHDLDGGIAFAVRTDMVNGHCHIWVGAVDAYRICRNFADFDDQQFRHDETAAGRTIHLVVGYCSPIIYCTCDPIVVAGLEDVQSAAMAPPPIIVCVREPCPGIPAPSYCTLESATPGANPYSTLNPREEIWGTDAGCDVDADTGDLYTCAPPSGFWVDRTVGPVHARVLVCDGGIGDRLPPLDFVSASAANPIGPCTCPPPTIEVNYCKLEGATPADLGLRTLVWGTDAGCDVDVDTNWYCLYGEIPVDRTVGPVHVTTRVCTPPLPPIEVVGLQ